MRNYIISALLVFFTSTFAFAGRYSVEDADFEEVEVSNNSDSLTLLRVSAPQFKLVIDLSGAKSKKDVGIRLDNSEVIKGVYSADSSTVSYTLKVNVMCDVVGFENPSCVLGFQHLPVDSVKACFVTKDSAVFSHYNKESLPYTFVKDSTFVPVSDTSLYVRHSSDTVFPALTNAMLEDRGALTNYAKDSVRRAYRDSILLSYVYSYAYDVVVPNAVDGTDYVSKVKGFCYIFPDDSVVIRRDSVLYKQESLRLSCEQVALCAFPIMSYTNKAGKKVEIKREFEVEYDNFDGENDGQITKETYAAKGVVVYLPTPNMKCPYILRETVFGKAEEFITDTFNIGVTVSPVAMFADKVEHNRADAMNELEVQFVKGEGGLLDNSFSTPFKVEMYGNPSPTGANLEWHFAYARDFKGSRIVYAQDRISMQIEHNKTLKQYIMFKAKNLNSGCTDSAWIAMNLSKPELFVPNIFTPNGDNKNDEFRVSYVSIKDFEIAIYNTFGKKVYESNDITKGWDGTYKGRDMANGAYYYVIEATDSAGNKIEKKGTVNLFRNAKD